jgi:hypothetical protein
MHPRFNAPELVPELLEISAALFKAIGNGSVPPATVGLIGMRACQITGNTYTLIRAAWPRLLKASAFAAAAISLD